MAKRTLKTVHPLMGKGGTTGVGPRPQVIPGQNTYCHVIGYRSARLKVRCENGFEWWIPEIEFNPNRD